MGCASGEDDINPERNQLGGKSGEPLDLSPGISVFNHDVAPLDVTKVTQSLTEGLELVRGGSGQIDRQVAYSSDLGRLLRPGGTRAEELAEEKGDGEGEPQPSHRDSGPSNSLRRRVRIGPASLWSSPRSLTLRLSGQRRGTRACGPL